MTSVLIVDDQILIRAGLAALVRAADGLEVAGEASSGEEAVDLAVRRAPDVVLMDIRLPGMSGIAALERILATARPAPRVVMLTVFDLDQYVYAALRAGASGFLLKDTPPERLLAALRQIAEGEMLFAPSVTRRLVEAFARQGEPVGGQPAELEALTVREREVLGLVGRGLSNDQIAQRLVVSIATVKTHVNRVLAKLALTSRAQAVVVAYESGLIAVGGGGALGTSAF